MEIYRDGRNYYHKKVRKKSPDTGGVFITEMKIGCRQLRNAEKKAKYQERIQTGDNNTRAELRECLDIAFRIEYKCRKIMVQETSKEDIKKQINTLKKVK